MERTFEIGLKKRVESVGGLCWKLTCPGTIGVPDRIVLLPGGRLVFVELKDTGKRLRAIQQFRHKQLQALGFDVVSIDSKKQLEGFGDDL